MKRTVMLMFVAALVALMTAGAYAQPGGGGGPGGGPGGRRGGMGPQGPGGLRIGDLLRNEEIKTRLNLTEEQTDKLQKIAEEDRGRGRGQGRGQGQGPGQGRGQGRGQQGERPQPPSAEERARFMEEMQKRQAERTAKINEVLNPEQRETFKVLSFQMAGGLEARNLGADMLDVVQLSDEQKSKIKALEAERRAEFDASYAERQRDFDRIRGMPEEERQAFREKMRTEGEERTKKFREKVKAVLTSEQLAKAEQLTEEGKSLRPERPERGRRGGEGGPEGEYRPGRDSWQPGQGNPRGRGQERGEGRRSFPRSE